MSRRRRELSRRYRIRCRQIVLLDQKKHTTEMRLQLYKVQEHAYLLDFQKLHGNVCSFMHMCGTVIDQLQRGLSRSSQLMGREADADRRVAHVTMKEV